MKKCLILRQNVTVLKNFQAFKMNDFSKDYLSKNFNFKLSFISERKQNFSKFPTCPTRINS